MRKFKKTAESSLAFVALTFGVLALILAMAGCTLSNNGGQGSSANVFAVDSKNGNVYEIDTQALTAASTPLLSIGQNASGELVFCGNTGFLAVGSYLNTAPGLYYFDVTSQAPVAKLLGSLGNTISAQYICILSTTKGYVSSADYSGVYTSAVYPFNPSKPLQDLGEAISGLPTNVYPQDIAVADGRVYVADNANNVVYRLDANGTAVESTFAAKTKGTTGLLAGKYDYDGDGDADAGVFVANTGGYDANWNPLPGSIDFIPASASADDAVTTVISDLSAARLAAFGQTKLVATGYSHTYLVELSGQQPRSAGSHTTAAKAEVTFDGKSFGSFDVNIHDGYAYVPDGANTVYRFSSSGDDVKAITVGKTGEFVTNIGIRE
ncbi:MAG TPA: hypothetical protein PLT87_09235 [Spirochaetales bacterium]|nr:hypothetical protein [Spirochaetales bacterium]